MNKPRKITLNLGVLIASLVALAALSTAGLVLSVMGADQRREIQSDTAEIRQLLSPCAEPGSEECGVLLSGLDDATLAELCGRLDTELVERGEIRRCR